MTWHKYFSLCFVLCFADFLFFIILQLKLHEYITAVFENLLDAQRIPLIVQYLFSKLDSLGRMNGAEQDILNCWRNER